MSIPVPDPVNGPGSGHPLVEFGTRLLTRLGQLTASSARPVWSLTP
ncbi:MAG: hypothetical protein JWR42_5, partial [Marmoricola sp.]|nr:hypothetical protein [Marmoricola sp.]